MAHISGVLGIIQHLVCAIIFDIADLITRQESHDIDCMLGVLHTKLQADAQLSNAVQYDVKPKRSQCDDVIEKIKLYQGPDQKSQEVLEANSARWASNLGLSGQPQRKTCISTLIHKRRSYIPTYELEAVTHSPA
jgi:hypothetical protein